MIIKKIKPILLGFYKPDLHDICHKDHKICFIVSKYVYFLIYSSKPQAMCIVVDMDKKIVNMFV
jgi:hypothetical protein